MILEQSARLRPFVRQPIALASIAGNAGQHQIPLIISATPRKRNEVIYLVFLAYITVAIVAFALLALELLLFILLGMRSTSAHTSGASSLMPQFYSRTVFRAVALVTRSKLHMVALVVISVPLVVFRSTTKAWQAFLTASGQMVNGQCGRVEELSRGRLYLATFGTALRNPFGGVLTLYAAGLVVSFHALLAIHPEAIFPGSVGMKVFQCSWLRLLASDASPIRFRRRSKGVDFVLTKMRTRATPSTQRFSWSVISEEILSRCGVLVATKRAAFLGYSVGHGKGSLLFITPEGVRSTALALPYYPSIVPQRRLHLNIRRTV